MNDFEGNVERPYDFAEPQRLDSDASGGLRRIHEMMARDLEQVLANEFDVEARGSIVVVEQVRYAKFVEREPGRAYHGVFHAAGFDCDMEILLPAATSLRLVDHLLGAAGGENRKLSIVDVRLLEKFVSKITTVIEDVMRPHQDPHLEFDRSETVSQVVKLTELESVVISVELLFTLGDHDLTIVVCYPQEPILPLLAMLSDLEREATDDAITTSPITGSLQRVQIPVSVRLPVSKIDAAEIDSLEVGDILQTGVSISQNPALVINGRPLLAVQTVDNNSRLACTVLGRYGARRPRKGRR